ncbi:MAG: Uma2 family endonuclease [Bacteroidota bacterium]
MLASRVLAYPLRKWNTSEYQRLVAAGFFSSEDHVELLDGQIIEMSPAGNFHAATVEYVVDQLRLLLPLDTHMIRSQNPVVLGDRSEPEPDIAVVDARRDYYRAGHPEAKDIRLLIEVADTSLEKDRNLKAELYAQAEIPEYWIINLEEEVIEQFSEPKDGRYWQQRIHHKESTFEIGLLSGQSVGKFWL